MPAPRTRTPPADRAPPLRPGTWQTSVWLRRTPDKTPDKKPKRQRPRTGGKLLVLLRQGGVLAFDPVHEGQVQIPGGAPPRLGAGSWSRQALRPPLVSKMLATSAGRTDRALELRGPGLRARVCADSIRRPALGEDAPAPRQPSGSWGGEGLGGLRGRTDDGRRSGEGFVRFTPRRPASDTTARASRPSGPAPPLARRRPSRLAPSAAPLPWGITSCPRRPPSRPAPSRRCSSGCGRTWRTATASPWRPGGRGGGRAERQCRRRGGAVACMVCPKGSGRRRRYPR